MEVQTTPAALFLETSRYETSIGATKTVKISEDGQKRISLHGHGVDEQGAPIYMGRLYKIQRAVGDNRRSEYRSSSGTPTALRRWRISGERTPARGSGEGGSEGERRRGSGGRGIHLLAKGVPGRRLHGSELLGGAVLVIRWEISAAGRGWISRARGERISGGRVGGAEGVGCPMRWTGEREREKPQVG